MLLENSFNPRDFTQSCRWSFGHMSGRNAFEPHAGAAIQSNPFHLNILEATKMVLVR